MFLGATIHDVAQVVGAGYAVSRETGDTATVVKLMRVAMLLPVIVCAAMITRARGGRKQGRRPPLLPWFAVAFIASWRSTAQAGWRRSVRELGNDASRWCLVIAISAIGLKTELKQLVSVGIRPIALMIGETVFLALLVLSLLHWAF